MICPTCRDGMTRGVCSRCVSKDVLGTALFNAAAKRVAVLDATLPRTNLIDRQVQDWILRQHGDRVPCAAATHAYNEQKFMLMWDVAKLPTALVKAKYCRDGIDPTNAVSR